MVSISYCVLEKEVGKAMQGIRLENEIALRIAQGLRQAKLAKEGKIQLRSLEELMAELDLNAGYDFDRDRIS